MSEGKGTPEHEREKGEGERDKVASVGAIAVGGGADDEVPLSQEELQHASQLLESGDVTAEKALPFAGFVSASGKPIAEPSTTAIERAKELVASAAANVVIAGVDKASEVTEEKTPSFVKASELHSKLNPKETTATTSVLDTPTQGDDDSSIKSWQSLSLSSPDMVQPHPLQQSPKKEQSQAPPSDEKPPSPKRRCSRGDCVGDKAKVK